MSLSALVNTYYKEFEDVLNFSDPKNVHKFFGLLYFVSAILAMSMNNLKIYWLYRRGSEWMNIGSRIVHYNLSFASIGIVLGFASSFLSCIHGKWIFGQEFCKWRAFEAFVSGLAILYFLYLTCLDRYLMLKYETWYNKYSFILMGLLSTLVWILSVAISTLPLYGYGKFCVEPQGTSCLVDWTNRDQNNVIFLASLAIFVFAIPALISLGLFLKAHRILVARNKQQSMTLVKMNTVVFWVFTLSMLSWLPYVVITQIAIFMPNVKFSLITEYCCVLGPKFGAALTPLVYLVLVMGGKGDRKHRADKPKIVYTKSGRAKKSA